ANRVAQLRRQVDGIDDGIVYPFHDVVALARLHVQLPRPVTALAADGQAPEDRPAIGIAAIFAVVRVIDVTEQALGGGRPLETLLARFESRRQAPQALLAIPGHGRLEEVAVVIDQKGIGSGPRADDVLGWLDDFGEDPTLGIESKFVLQQLIATFLHAIVE